MKALVVYDSEFGNTERVANKIVEGLKSEVKVKIELAGKNQVSELSGVDLLVLGSPVQGGRAIEGVQEFLHGIPDGGLKGVAVAVFDTRFRAADQNVGLKILMRMIGYAGDKMGESLEKKGGRLVVEPEGFIVKGKEGPLEEGELARAKKWGRELVQLVKERRRK